MTDIADAYLIDPSVVDRVVVVAALGTYTAPNGAMNPPNGELDPWADWIVAQVFQYIQVSAFYDQTGDVTAAEQQLRASSGAFDEIGAATSATTHRAFLAEVVVRLGRLEEAEELAQQVAAEAARDEVITQVLWRCALARIRAREGSPGEALELAAEARSLLPHAEFPQLSIRTLTAAAEASAAADDGAEVERLLAEARKIAEAKGAVASLAQLEAVRVAG